MRLRGDVTVEEVMGWGLLFIIVLVLYPAMWRVMKTKEMPPAIATARFPDKKTGGEFMFGVQRYIETRPGYVKFLATDGSTVEVEGDNVRRKR